MRRRALAAILLSCLLLPGASTGRSRKRRPAGPSDFSYYLLVLSYAPDFCDQARRNKDPRECGAGRRIGFVVHGLWPQGEDSRGPEFCAPASPASQAIVQAALRYIPGESLIQHEWAAHGTCSGLSAGDYFAALGRARDSVSLPPELNQPTQQVRLSPAQIEEKMAGANRGFPENAFRTSCYRNGELQEVRICLNKDLSPRACGRSAGACVAPVVTLLPVR